MTTTKHDNDPHGVTEGRCSWCGQSTTAEKQRDELLEALRNVVVSHEAPTYGDNEAYIDHMTTAVEFARAAIAKVR